MTQGNMFGAVDLSELKKPETPESPSGDAGQVSGPLVRQVGMQNLEALISSSTTVPFVLVFHSERSEHSVELKNLLTTAVESKGGALGLGIVDIDENREVAGAFRIQAVPTTIALIGGNPMPLFQGKPADDDIAEVISKVLEAATQMGVTGRLDGGEEPEVEPEKFAPHVKEGMDAMASGDLELAHTEFTAALKENPGEDSAHAGLAQVELLQRIADVDPTEVLTQAQNDEGLQAQLLAADVELAAGRPDAAFSRLLHVISTTSGDDKETARKRILELFTVLGPADPIVGQARRALANVLL